MLRRPPSPVDQAAAMVAVCLGASRAEDTGRSDFKEER